MKSLRLPIFRFGLLLLAVAGFALARTAAQPPSGQRIYDTKWLNINKWLCPFYNDGKYGIDLTSGGDAGGSWPQPFKNCYIFGAGMWFGSLKPNPNDTSKVDTLVTFGYNPNSGGTEMTPTITAFADQGAGSTDDRVYMYPTDWQIPRERWINAYPGDTMIDLLVPRENFSLQDMWCAYSDVLPENHISPGKPQGIDIFQTVYAWNYPANQDIFFIIYHVRNSGTDTLKECYIGAVMDADVGAAADDMVGLLLNNYVPGMDTSRYPTVTNVGYVGDYDNQENRGSTWEQGTPGVFAYKFLASPRGANGRELGMTAFKKFTIDIDPVTDPAQYLTMAGYDYRTGVYSAYDSIDLAPADKRFIQCSGPFTLAPGQVERLVVAAIGAPFGGPRQTWNARPADSLVHLANVANAAQYIFDQNWLLPAPPLAPNVTLIPGDNQVRIIWDDLPERTPDPYWQRVVGDPNSPAYDSVYIGYDFQGYMLLKSRDGATWTTLAQYDKNDSFPRPPETLFVYAPGGDTINPIRMRNNGLRYTYTDNDVTNGFTYYYCVLAYDWNYQTNIQPGRTRDTLILRSGIVSNISTVPRWEPANYIQPEGRILTASGDTVAPGLRMRLSVAAPFLVTSDTYELRFDPPVHRGGNTSGAKTVTYNYALLRPDTIGFDTVTTGSIPYTLDQRVVFWLPVFNGFDVACTLRVNTPTQVFDTIFSSNPFFETRARPSGAANQGYWAFRGSTYRIEWGMDPTNTYKTARVFDETHNGLEVLARRYNATGTNDSADGWCFVDRLFRSSRDTLKSGSYRIYICGGYLTLNAGDSIGALIDSIRPGDVWTAVGRVNSSFPSAPSYNRYRFIPKPGIADVTKTYQLDVKVVPNPYIVFNGWERSTEQRVVKFTHLPDECTIRIYTTSGDLVKTIHHKSRSPGVQKDQPLAAGGTATWDFTNESPGMAAGSAGQSIASGVYIWHVESAVGEQVGKLVVIY